MQRERDFAALLDEDVFVAQLAARARLLNDDFQARVLDIIRSHMAKTTTSGDRDCSNSASDSCEVMCLFEGRVEGQITVHPAPPKSVQRMREKLTKYAAPHPKAIWPLSANILDPVRVSLVCRGPAQMLEVLSWFSGNAGAKSGFRMCRLKNRFAFPEDEITDGYRDLKICVVFQSSNGLHIIGEIQVRDHHSVHVVFSCSADLSHHFLYWFSDTFGAMVLLKMTY